MVWWTGVRGVYEALLSGGESHARVSMFWSHGDLDDVAESGFLTKCDGIHFTILSDSGIEELMENRTTVQLQD